MSYSIFGSNSIFGSKTKPKETPKTAEEEKAEAKKSFLQMIPLPLRDMVAGQLTQAIKDMYNENEMVIIKGEKKIVNGSPKVVASLYITDTITGAVKSVIDL